jgi:hypothetical protein
MIALGREFAYAEPLRETITGTFTTLASKACAFSPEEQPMPDQLPPGSMPKMPAWMSGSASEQIAQRRVAVAAEEARRIHELDYAEKRIKAMDVYRARLAEHGPRAQARAEEMLGETMELIRHKGIDPVLKVYVRNGAWSTNDKPDCVGWSMLLPTVVGHIPKQGSIVDPGLFLDTNGVLRAYLGTPSRRELSAERVVWDPTLQSELIRRQTSTRLLLPTGATSEPAAHTEYGPGYPTIYPEDQYVRDAYSLTAPYPRQVKEKTPVPPFGMLADFLTTFAISSGLLDP